MTEPHTFYPRHLPRKFTVIFSISAIWEYVENLLTFHNSLIIFFCFSVQAYRYTISKSFITVRLHFKCPMLFKTSLTFTSSLYKDIVVMFSFKHFIHKYIVT